MSQNVGFSMPVWLLPSRQSLSMLAIRLLVRLLGCDDTRFRAELTFSKARTPCGCTCSLEPIWQADANVVLRLNCWGNMGTKGHSLSWRLSKQTSIMMLGSHLFQVANVPDGMFQQQVTLYSSKDDI